MNDSLALHVMQDDACLAVFTYDVSTWHSD